MVCVFCNELSPIISRDGLIHIFFQFRFDFDTQLPTLIPIEEHILLCYTLYITFFKVVNTDGKMYDDKYLGYYKHT